MDAAFAGNLGMELVAATNEPDPRIIITPLIASHVEELLRKYNLLDDWMHILVGIRNGFDVGIRDPPLSTCLFRKSHLVALKSFLHRFIYHQRTSCWPLLSWIYPRRARTHNWSIYLFTFRPRAEASLEQISPHTRSIIPSKQPCSIFCQCWNRYQRVPYNMGFIRQHSRFDPHVASRMCRSDIRCLCSIPHHPHSTKPTKLTVCLLARDSLCRPSANVWTILQCWGFLAPLPIC